MAWEPWLKASESKNEEYDPTDPGLLVNVFKDDPNNPTDEEMRQWVSDFIFAPEK